MEDSANRGFILYIDIEERLPGAFRRTTKFWIRMPNWLGDIVMVIPLINATMQVVRIQLSFLLNLNSGRFLKKCFLKSPNRSSSKKYSLELCLSFQITKKYPSLIINFANSLRSDIESFIIGAPRRYGIIFTKRCRPLLTHGYHHNLDQGNSQQSLHQVQCGKSFAMF